MAKGSKSLADGSCKRSTLFGLSTRRRNRTYVFDEPLHDGARSPLLQRDERDRRRDKVYVDVQALQPPRLGVLDQDRGVHDGDEETGCEQLRPEKEGSRGDAHDGKTRSSRFGSRAQ